MSELASRIRFSRPVKQFRIGEVVRFSGLSRQTVHNYTIMGLISEDERTEGGHRLYPESVFDTLARIDELKSTKTLREIRVLLDKERMDDENTDMKYL
ncbi:MAG: MerR family DNA-binding transcriptional regulator [Sedimentisphaerales bacterium]|nr:MerR family DNA-binding transcriptional regulator [Sedimentisphaerales bacterium]